MNAKKPSANDENADRGRAGSRGSGAVLNAKLVDALVDALLDAAASPILLAREDASIIRLSRSAALFFGRSEREAVGKSVGEILSPELQLCLEKSVRELRIDGDRLRVDLKLRDHRGIPRRFAVCVRLLRPDGADPAAYLVEMKRSGGGRKDELRKVDMELSILRLMKGFSDSAILIDNLSRTICECNSAAEMKFGYSRGELIGRGPRFLVAESERSQDLIGAIHEAYARQGFFQAKINCSRKDGSCFMTLGTYLTFADAKGEPRYTLAINRDITEEERRLSEIAMLTERSKEYIDALAAKLQPLLDTKPAVRLSELGFSERQVRIASLICEGEPIKSIASRLESSDSTIKSHIHSMYVRLGVSSKIEFVNYLRDRNIRLE